MAPTDKSKAGRGPAGDSTPVDASEAQLQELAQSIARIRAQAGLPPLEDARSGHRAGSAEQAPSAVVSAVQRALAAGRAPASTLEQVCDRHGPYLAREIVLLGVARWSGCPQCVREAADQRLHQEDLRGRQVRQAKRQSQIEELLSESGVPVRYLHASLDAFVREDARGAALENLRATHAMAQSFRARLEHAARGAGNLLVYGGWNTGKTHLGCSLVRAALEAGLSGYYTTQQRMIGAIRRSWKSGESGPDLMTFTDCHVLVIDEVGVGFGTEAEKLQLFDVLDARYQNRLSTVLVTNMPSEDLWGFLGQRLQNKLTEDGLDEIQCLFPVDF